MNVTETEFDGLYIIEPKVIKDSRGYFMECYNKLSLSSYGIHSDFVQDNQSSSSYGVIRGLHFQNPPFAQTKLVRVLSGVILDTVVDLRKGSNTYKRYFSIELSAENNKQLYVPKGFAHGFAVLSQTAEIHYKCDQYYNKNSESGIYYADSDLEIDWQIPNDEVILSEKDKLLPRLDQLSSQF